MNNAASIQELIYVFNKAAQLLVPACPHFTPIFLTAAVRKESRAETGESNVAHSCSHAVCARAR